MTKQNNAADYKRADPSKWPKGVRVLGINEQDNLGIDDQGQLYWDGRPVVVSRGIDLTFWQKVAAFAGVISAGILAFVALAEFIIKYL